MKLPPIILAVTLLGSAELGFGQRFTNLDFESASLVPASAPFYVEFDSAFPGWVGTVGGIQQTLALSNTLYLDSAGISIINSSYTIPIGGLIQGNYTAILMSGLGNTTNGFGPAETTLSQTGRVPANAHSLQFEAVQAVGGATGIIPFGVTLGGQTLSLIALSNTLNYTIYGADISAWANQTVPLTFTVFAENPHVDNQYLYLDAIQFSTQPVPEPSELALLSIGAFLFGLRRW